MKPEFEKLFDFLVKAWIFNKEVIEFKHLQVVCDVGIDSTVEFVNSAFVDGITVDGVIHYKPSYDAICFALLHTLRPFEAQETKCDIIEVDWRKKAE